MYSMKNYDENQVVVTGCGVISAVGQGKEEFISALLQGKHAFNIMQRLGRQNNSNFIGAEIAEFIYHEALNAKHLRRMSLSAKAAIVTLHEAWKESKLDEVESNRIGLIIGGSNFQQRELVQIHEKYKERTHYIQPTYGISFMDSDLCGICTEEFGIKGLAYTVGGASASGQVSILQAIQAVQSNQVDVCIVIGALMDLSYWECQAFRSLGAMGSDRYANDPTNACRPFDQARDGFIFGECCGAIVIESMNSARKRQVKPYAEINGAMLIDGNRNPNPSYAGEVNVIKKALKNSNLQANEIDYINPHGTGSIIGDETEVKAIIDCGLSNAYVNATKSITGHGLSAAGTVEVIATLLQMKALKLHPTRNLENPISKNINWVKQQAIDHEIKHAINLSMGFGGVNTAICLKKLL